MGHVFNEILRDYLRLIVVPNIRIRIGEWNNDSSLPESELCN
jgi:hypothetical protein